MRWIRNQQVDNNIWEVVKALLQYAIAPLGAFLIWSFKKHQAKVDSLEQRISQVEKSTAIIQVMVDHIRDDIKDIKAGIDKLISRI